MKPQIVAKPAFTVVGMVIRARPMTPEIPGLWQQFAPRMGELQHLAEPGVSYGLMDNVDHEAGRFDYMAACAVEKAVDLPAGMARWDVPANTYAVLETTLPAIGQAFDFIYESWLPASGYRRAAGPDFERYGEAFNPDDPTSRLSIYIPVEERA